MLDEKTRALLGDREAQEAFTARGELLPCPGCNGEETKHRAVMACVMIECQCGFMAAGYDLDEARRIWNQRAPLLTPTQMAVLERETEGEADETK